MKTAATSRPPPIAGRQAPRRPVASRKPARPSRSAATSGRTIAPKPIIGAAPSASTAESHPATFPYRFPAAAPAYARVYGPIGGAGARYTPRWQTEQVQERVRRLKEQFGLAERRRPAPSTGGADAPTPAPTADRLPQQLALPF